MFATGCDVQVQRLKTGNHLSCLGNFGYQHVYAHAFEFSHVRSPLVKWFKWLLSKDRHQPQSQRKVNPLKSQPAVLVCAQSQPGTGSQLPPSMIKDLVATMTTLETRQS